MAEQGYLRKYIDLIRENESLPESERFSTEETSRGIMPGLERRKRRSTTLEEHFETGISVSTQI